MKPRMVAKEKEINGCSYCGAKLSTKYNVKRHEDTCSFNPSRNLTSNSIPKQSTSSTKVPCQFCKSFFSNKANLKRHQSTCLQNPDNPTRIKSHRIRPSKFELSSTRVCRFCYKSFTRNDIMRKSVDHLHIQI